MYQYVVHSVLNLSVNICQETHCLKVPYLEPPLVQTIVSTRLASTLMAVFSFPMGKFLAPRRENLHCSVIPLCWSVGRQKKDGQ